MLSTSCSWLRDIEILCAPGGLATSKILVAFRLGIFKLSQPPASLPLSRERPCRGKLEAESRRHPLCFQLLYIGDLFTSDHQTVAVPVTDGVPTFQGTMPGPQFGPQPPEITLKADWDKQEMVSEPSSTRQGCNLIHLMQQRCQAAGGDNSRRKCQELVSKYHDCGRSVALPAFLFHALRSFIRHTARAECSPCEHPRANSCPSPIKCMPQSNFYCDNPP